MSFPVVPAVIAGPAIVTFNGVTWYSEGDIVANISQSTWDVSTSRFAVISKRVKSLPVGKISFTPDGQVTSGRMAAAFPFGLADVGKSILTAANVPLVIWTIAGKKYTFTRAGLEKTPSLYLGADKTAFGGSMDFLALSGIGLDPTAANSFVKVETAAFVDVSFDERKVITPGFTAAFGTTPYDVILSKAGFMVDLPVSVAELEVNRYGVIEAFLKSVGPAHCAFEPAGLTEAQVLTLLALDAGLKLPGQDVSADSTDLVITGTGLTVTLAKAGIQAGGFAFGTVKERFGTVTFYNRAVFAVGVPGSLLMIAVS